MVIIDELGRGTGVEEGAALCFAISEYILSKAKPFVFFVTHFQDLEQLANIYPNVVNYHFQVDVPPSPTSRPPFLVMTCCCTILYHIVLENVHHIGTQQGTLFNIESRTNLS